SEPSNLPKSPAGSCVSHDPYWAKESVRLETPRDKLIPTDPSTESGCKAIERPVPPNSRLAPTPTPTPIAPLAPTYVPASAPRLGPGGGSKSPPRHAPACRNADIETNCAHHTNIGFRRIGTTGHEPAGHP